MIAASTSTEITAVVAAFFLLLALIWVGRAIFTRDPPASHTFRIGVFVERDHDPKDDDEQ